MSARLDRVTQAIKEELSNIIQYELNDPRIGFVTVTKVELSKDLQHAKMYFSLLGNESKKKSALIGLNSAKGYIRSMLSKRLSIKFIPELIFILDESLEYSQHISDVLDKIKREEDEK